MGCDSSSGDNTVLAVFSILSPVFRKERKLKAEFKLSSGFMRPAQYPNVVLALADYFVE